MIYHYKLRKGNIVEAFKKCDIIVENNYETSMVDHEFLQPKYKGKGCLDEGYYYGLG
ncbi:MAG TPA: hypothetical protein VEB00_02465 [Clostridia bacterium]|nr:hypothetical protein [Clostridia bacterium]